MSEKKKHILKIPIIVLSVILIAMMSLGIVTHAAEKKTGSNKYNVVFVMDASGSLNQTDPDEYRFEAMDMFIGLLANSGNHVGTVAFGEGVVFEHPLEEVKDFAGKKKYTEELRNIELENWTDIGSGLLRATELIRNNGDPDLPSIILLLTDGNTTMETSEKLAESISKKEDAVENARQDGTQIYTITLNKNKEANADEMKQIAEATGGEFREVAAAEDIQSVFELYYQLIYSTTGTEISNEHIPGNGILSKDFSVANVGVEEVNMIVFGDVSKCTLTKPDGTPMSEQEMKDVTYAGKTFSILKMQDPASGKWNLKVEAPPDSSIRIFKVYNPNLSVETQIKDKKDTYGAGNEIGINAVISEGGKALASSSDYSEYQATLTVRDYQGKEIYTDTKSEAGDGGFAFSFTPKDLGTYYASVSVKGDELSAESEEISMDVGNTPPVLNEAELKKHINRWPFLIKTDKTVDLSGIATDAEDKVLTYRVSSSTWPEGDYTLEGDKLTIDKFSVSKGSFTIDAVDSMGAYVTSEVRITSTNVGLWAAILILAAIIGGAIAAAVITYKKLRKPFTGEITVENIETGKSDIVSKNRGRLELSNYRDVGLSGLDGYFQATGKKEIYFISKKPVFASNLIYNKTDKKILIKHRDKVKISSNKDFENGIIVKFESFLNR